MNKIFLVLQREYLVRVRKRSFIIMTILTPILLAALFVVPILLTFGLEEEKVVEVIDQTEQIRERLKDESKVKFVKSEFTDLEKARDNLKASGRYALLYIPEMDFQNPKEVKLLAEKSISLNLELDIRDQVEQAIENIKLEKSGIDKNVLDEIKTKVSIQSEKLSGEESSSAAAYFIGLLVAFIIYMSVLLYSQQVMRGVVEEKTSRIIEVIISSVRPFQLMMGKILGVAAIGLTQFVLWIVLTFALVTGASYAFNLNDYAQERVEQQAGSQEVKEAQQAEQKHLVEKMMNEVSTVPITLLLACFLFYFVGGYLIYSALFAAVGSAADSETDTQQFVLPVSAPLIIAFVAFQAVLQDPDGPVAFWMSMIPFTSPIIMMVRLPFGGVMTWELILSMVLLILGFIGITWIAARIYRIGILMYGKKVNLKEIGKWVFYKP